MDKSNEEEEEKKEKKKQGEREEEEEVKKRMRITAKLKPMGNGYQNKKKNQLKQILY